ncbi:MAG: hypothetical protein IV105_02285 [Rhizobacter sp.]|nr:hypothetical protein [Rhizobacter sp.]
MKKLLLWFTLAAAAGSASANPQVGVSVSVNQPGLYGRIDIGHAPVPPVLMYPQPVIIVPQPVAVQAPEPIYLHVPPGHSRNWRKHCRRYHACGQPVYFVREDWYQRHYHPHRHHRHDRHDRYERRERHDDRHDRWYDNRRYHHDGGRDR